MAVEAFGSHFTGIRKSPLPSAYHRGRGEPHKRMKVTCLLTGFAVGIIDCAGLRLGFGLPQVGFAELGLIHGGFFHLAGTQSP